MYNPPAFAETRVPVLHAAMRDIGLATLVTLDGDGLVASHVPMLVEPAPAPYGTLLCHVARANPQWRAPSRAVEALAVFLGPERYISPSLYPSKAETGRVVPTWNYVAVHAWGRLETFDDPARLLDLVTRLTDRHEATRAAPWAVSDAPDDFVAGQLKGIVGLALTVTRLDGKWKTSQNRPAADRAGVVDGLAATGDADDARMAALVRERDPERSR
ncbi:MAG: FMN-binding negative transcriptional regulator [Alphaproteobacteria bacterium]